MKQLKLLKALSNIMQNINKKTIITFLKFLSLVLVAVYMINAIRFGFSDWLALVTTGDPFTLVGLGIALTGFLLACYQLFLQVDQSRDNRERSAEARLLQRLDERCDDLSSELNELCKRVSAATIALALHEVQPGHEKTLNETLDLRREVASLRSIYETFSHVMEHEKRIASLELKTVLLSTLASD